jgi:hypothetical protein
MTPDFKKLIMGDVVRHKGTKQVYVIMQVHNFGTDLQSYSAVRPINVSNESEWEIIPRNEIERHRPK